jgi:hypothetical protein
MRQRFQRRAKPIFHFARAVSHASHFPEITGEKCDDPIGLSERVCLQYNRVALIESHTDFPEWDGPTTEFFEKRDLEK